MRAASIHLGIALLVLAVCVPVMSAAAPIAVGIKGGLSAATLHGDLPSDPFVEHGTRLGVGGGLSVTIGMGGRFALQPEMLYVMKGTSLGDVDLTDDSGNSLGTARVTEAIDYLELPVLARAALPATALLRPFLVAGPTLGVRLSQRLRTKGIENDSLQELDFVKRVDLGAALGAGVELGGRGRCVLEARYTLGLTQAAETTYSDDARNGALLVMAGIAIHQ
jgi:hypothetical protein